MLFPVIIFWVSLFVLFYCYLGYGAVLYIYNRIKHAFRRGESARENSNVAVPVTLIISAYNEKAVLPEKIANTLAIDYPPESLQVIIITDGSTDGSEKLVSEFSAIRLLHQPERKGKTAAIRRAMQSVETPIVVFSDANTFLNPGCIRVIVAHYDDGKVGGVAGEKKIAREKIYSPVGTAEGLYWRYESFMKQQDSDFNTVVGAAGELFSIRSELLPVINDNIILDDFFISMKICLAGYRIVYEPAAFATELPSPTLADEEARKVRISAGVYQCIGLLKEALNIFNHPLLSFQYLSRRILRWLVCPAMLILLFLSNIQLAYDEKGFGWYSLLMTGQAIFYFTAIIGWVLAARNRNAVQYTIPFYFIFMNYCLIKGLFRFLKGKQTVLWDKSARQSMQ